MAGRRVLGTTLAALVAAAVAAGGAAAAAAAPVAASGRPVGGAANGSPAVSPAPTNPTNPSSPVANGPTRAGDNVEQEPSAAEVAAEQARAQALLDEVTSRQGAVTDARAQLDAATTTAALALERASGATVAARTARLEADRQSQLLLEAQLRLAAQKAVLGRWARRAYGDGDGDLAANPALATILGGGNTDDLGRAETYLRHVGNSKGRALEGFAQALQAQAEAARAAETAEATAQAASRQAALAREQADAAVAQRRDVLAGLETQLSQAQEAAADARQRAVNLAAARTVAQSRSGGPNRVTGRVGDCRGADTSVFANGRIPLSALCPLWGTANHYLRADAAYAFNRLSQAYAQEFGEPICVTDSYRDYDTQVRLYATKPNLAAVPGTSNHGWGAATDLCGGIQNFGTPTHTWMLQHATEHGWFHPSWARAGGSRPEPWHWEFAG